MLGSYSNNDSNSSTLGGVKAYSATIKVFPFPLARRLGSVIQVHGNSTVFGFCRLPSSRHCKAFQSVSTPLNPEAWGIALTNHPDRAFTHYVSDGLQHGFRVGFAYSAPLRSASANMESARQHPQMVSDYLAKELALGRLFGPFSDQAVQALPALHINRFGVIPKGHNSGNWHLITDLSYSHGHSVIDGIDPSLCSLEYTTVDEVAKLVVNLGRGALLSKVDIESAYRLISVHTEDRPLLAVHWDHQVYVDPMLPFGLRLAPKIFNAVADGLNWCLTQAGIRHIVHYLDDFIFVTPPGSEDGLVSMEILNRVCGNLGVLIAENKRDGPTVCTVFLSIEIDTIALTLRLPQDKMARLLSLLESWGDRKSCSHKELESLIGLLNHVCKVLRSGQSFLRWMIDLLHSVHRLPYSKTRIRLSAGFRSDLGWWRKFVNKWNGISFLPAPSHLPTVEITSDASGLWECGA